MGDGKCCSVFWKECLGVTSCVMSTPVSCHIINNFYLLEWLRIGFNEKLGRNIAV